MKKRVLVLLISFLTVFFLVPRQSALSKTNTDETKPSIVKKVKVTIGNNGLKLSFHAQPNTSYTLKDLNDNQLAAGTVKKGTVSLNRLRATSTKLILKTSRHRHTSKKIIPLLESYEIPRRSVYRKPVAIGSKITYYGANNQLLFTIQTKYLPNTPQNKTGISLTFHNYHYAIPLTFSPTNFTAYSDNQQVALQPQSPLPMIKSNEEKTINFLIDVPREKAIQNGFTFDNSDLTLPINFYL
ncbi:hypothetical protein Lpp221_07251 [Lacticaseibacillus paracasei subsp. paracasei Lpp221]|uniref:hypothetical protein n=1 Tax=Lacticaseibacillus paracasei TaxID=1597 RepID=UPI000343D058|nr:hypothetical protein [Lacticaseibacillus paracasei]EPC79179.1 hypothetical protein Lpp221_07251 [Lacticaseibacillus paracasei subsp. paracasei Lpp221]